jgi:uncharacterized membrane protein YuzA (DUF378 family)
MVISAAFAFEVMDKEWPLWLVLVGFLGLDLVGMLLCRKWLIAILFLPLVVFCGIRQVLELNDPYVGGPIRQEAGLRYVALSYLAFGSSLILLVVGTVQGWASRKRSPLLRLMP